jgi:pyruvate ferredoxin oxidoreductase alpha subunit
MIIYGDLALQMEDAVDQVRDEGYKVGMVKLRHFRPFPTEDVIRVAKKVELLGVVDRATAFGSRTGGPVSCEVKSVLHNTEVKTTVLPIINGLGGREVTLEQQKEQLRTLVRMNESGQAPKDMIFGTYWDGLLEVK